MAAKGAYAVIIVPKICWEGRTQPWMSLFLLALEVVAVAHQDELRPSVNGPALSCFENSDQSKGPPNCQGIVGSRSVSKEISSMSRARTGHLLVLISRPWEQSQQTLGFSVQFWEGGIRAAFIPLIIFILIFSLSPSWSAVLGYLVSGFLSLTGITLSYKFNPNSWSVKNWLLGSVCIVALTETKSLLHWELTKWKRVSFPCMFSLKWLALFLERSGIFAGTCKG